MIEKLSVETLRHLPKVMLWIGRPHGRTFACFAYDNNNVEILGARKSCLTKAATNTYATKIDSNNDDRDTTCDFLHVGPSGDCWTGTTIFAAKHLQPDYVVSVRLPHLVCRDKLLEILEEDVELAKKIYDHGAIPQEVLKEAASFSLSKSSNK